MVFYKEIEFERDAAEMKDGDDPTSSAWLARGYWVFNAEQVDGYNQPERPSDTLPARLPSMHPQRPRRVCRRLAAPQCAP